MKNKITLIFDAFINLVLGVLLLSFNWDLCSFLGVPCTESSFYPNILGAVFIGIALALLIEAYRKENSRHTGLGLTGAVCINLCGGTVLALWLIFGDLNLPLRGQAFLWSLALILMILSTIELIFQIRSANK
jgi:hypothetical protein